MEVEKGEDEEAEPSVVACMNKAILDKNEVADRRERWLEEEDDDDDDGDDGDDDGDSDDDGEVFPHPID